MPAVSLTSFFALFVPAFRGGFLPKPPSMDDFYARSPRSARSPRRHGSRAHPRTASIGGTALHASTAFGHSGTPRMLLSQRSSTNKNRVPILPAPIFSSSAFLIVSPAHLSSKPRPRICVLTLSVGASSSTLRLRPRLGASSSTCVRPSTCLSHGDPRLRFHCPKPATTPSFRSARSHRWEPLARRGRAH